MKGDKLYLEHILERIARIFKHTSGGYEVYLEQEIIQDAVLRNLEVIGEAVKQISPQLRQQHPQIPWRRIAGLRDVLIHDYMGVDLDEVWNVIENDLEVLESQIRSIITQ